MCKYPKKGRCLIKWLKPFSIGGKHPLTIINPFTWKRFNLERLYNTIYIFNKVTKWDLKPIPYSKKLTEIEKKTNKDIVESIIYELRILFLSYTLIIVGYIYWLITSELKIGLFHTMLILFMIIVFVSIIKLSIKLLQTKNITAGDHNCDCEIIDQYIYRNPVEDILQEQAEQAEQADNKDCFIKKYWEKIRCKKH